MPTFRLQYGLRATHIDNNIAGVSHQQVYNLISEELRQRNWIRHQSSKWYKPGIPSRFAARLEADAVFIAAEALFGLPARPAAPNHIFHGVEIQQQVVNTVLRP